MLFSCNKTRDDEGVIKDDIDTSIFEPAGVCTVFLVPMDGITNQQITQLKTDLEKKFFEGMYNSFVVDTLPHLISNNDCLNEKKSRLSAKKMIKFLRDTYEDKVENRAKRNAKQCNWKYGDWYIIGITNKDISTFFPDRNDFGILGLSYLRNGKASIISTFRLRNKKDLWKLAAHEFGHGFCGAPHCPNDDPTCIMQDAKHGNPHFELKNSLCTECYEIIDPAW